MTRSLASDQIVKRLREEYSFGEGWITAPEVTMPPPGAARADLLAIQGWRSRGLQCIGFEVKARRQDWLDELARPAKSDSIVAICNRFWLVAAPGVVNEPEVPVAWGYMVANPVRFAVVREAPDLSPAPWTADMWQCMLLRIATRMAKEEPASETELDEAYSEGYAAGAESERQKNGRDLAEAKELIASAEEATGVPLARWSAYPAIRAALRICQGGVGGGLANRLDHNAKELIGLAKRMRDFAETVREPDRAAS